MPRGQYERKPKTEPAPQTFEGPAPLIIIQPGPNGTAFNAYGLNLPAVIDELRRTLVHLVAGQAGVQVISHEIPRKAAVVAASNGSHIDEETDL